MLIPDTQLDLSPHAMIIDFGLSRALKPRADIGLARAFREELDLEMRKVKYVLDYKGARDEERKLWYEGGERARFQANKQVRELRKKGDFWPLLWDEVFDETAGEGGEGEVKVWDTRWMWFDPVCGIRKAAEAPARRWDVGFRVKDMPPLDQLLEEVERYDEQDEDEMEVDADEGYIADVSMDVDEENQEQQHPVAGPSGLQPPVRASSERSPTASVSPTSQLSTSTSSNDTLSSTNSTSSTLESILSSATSDMLSSDDARALHYLIHNLGAGNDGSDKAKLERARLICAFIERKREEFLMRTHVLGRAKEALMSCITKFGLDSSSSFDGTMCESKGKGKEKEVVRFDIPVDTVSLKGTSSDTDRVLARVLDTWERSTYPQLDGSVHQDIIVGDRRLRDPAAPRPAHRLTLEGFQSARGLKRKRNDEVVISEEDDDEMPRMIAGGRKRGRRAVSAEPTSSDEVERMIVVRASSGRKNKRARTN